MSRIGAMPHKIGDLDESTDDNGVTAICGVSPDSTCLPHVADLQSRRRIWCPAGCFGSWR